VRSSEDIYPRSPRVPEEFRAEAVVAIDPLRPWQRVFDATTAASYRRFAGGSLNSSGAKRG